MVGFWDRELGEGVGGAGGGCEFELGMDGTGVGVLWAVNRGGWEKGKWTSWRAGVWMLRASRCTL